MFRAFEGWFRKDVFQHSGGLQVRSPELFLILGPMLHRRVGHDIWTYCRGQAFRDLTLPHTCDASRTQNTEKGASTAGTSINLVAAGLHYLILARTMADSVLFELSLKLEFSSLV